ncbi:hypothetical protein GEMRC1_008167 [Eukaryota sp. GEM-RC1]
MAKAISKPTIVKKRTNTFKRWQSDRFSRVDPSWRKPRGIDSRVRRRFKGITVMPSIGFGSNKDTRHLQQDGFFRMVVRNAAELEALTMSNRRFAAVLHHSLSKKSRKELVSRAKELNINVVNAEARLRVEATA